MFGFSVGLRVIVFLVVTLFLSSCSSAQVLQAVVPMAMADDRVRAAELIANVCEEQAGEFVYETASNVNGFLLVSDRAYENGRDQPGKEIGSAGCSGRCLEYFVRGYTFLEADVTAAPRTLFGMSDSLEVETGRYRYALEPRDVEICTRYDLLRRHSPLVQRLEHENPDLLDGKCLVARRIDVFQSRYGYQHHFSEPAFRLADDLVGNKIGSRVLELATGEEMAVNVRISAHKPGVQNHHVGSCGPLSTVKFIKILQPVQNSESESQ